MSKVHRGSTGFSFTPFDWCTLLKCAAMSVDETLNSSPDTSKKESQYKTNSGFELAMRRNTRKWNFRPPTSNGLWVYFYKNKIVPQSVKSNLKVYTCQSAHRNNFRLKSYALLSRYEFFYLIKANTPYITGLNPSQANFPCSKKNRIHFFE